MMLKQSWWLLHCRHHGLIKSHQFNSHPSSLSSPADTLLHIHLTLVLTWQCFIVSDEIAIASDELVLG